MDTCLFCKIVSGQLPSSKVYEDDRVLAILDIHPVNPGHTLVIAKEHYPTTSETPDDLVAHIALVTKKIAGALMTGLGVPAYNIEVNSGAVAGQLVMHTHWHIVPRTNDDGLKHWAGKSYAEGEAARTAEQICSALR